MGKLIQRSIQEPKREGLSWDERWKGDDRGLIASWEVGRSLRERKPELVRKAENGELPPLGWKGGVETKIKSERKTGTLWYLAQWQGLRGEDLSIELGSEPQLKCSRTNVTVTFTGDFDKYKSA